MKEEKSIMLDTFEKWYGFTVCEDMDIQTEVAWHNWQRAWTAAEKERDVRRENRRTKTWPIGNRITVTLKYEPRWPCFAFGFIGHREIVLMVWAAVLSVKVGY